MNHEQSVACMLKSWWLTACLLLTMLFSFHAEGIAQSSADNGKQRQNFECIGSYGEKVESAIQHGQYVFLNQGYTLGILDIKDPVRPIEIARLRLDGKIDAMQIKWPALYVGAANTGEGLKVFDISDPAHPRLTESFQASGTSVNLNIMGGFLLAESRDNRMVEISVYNVKSPLKPVLCCSDQYSIVNQYYAEDYGLFATDGDHLFYVSLDVEPDENGDRRVAIKDATTSTTTLGYRTLPDDARINFEVDDGRLVVGDSATTMTVKLADVRMADTVWIYKADTVWSSAGLESIILKKHAPKSGRITVEESERGLEIFEKDGNSSPTLRSVYGAHYGADQFKTAGGRGYLIDHEGGLQVLDLKDPAHPCCLARHEQFDPEILAIEDNLLFLAGIAPGFRVLDFSNPASPTLRGEYKQAAGLMSIRDKRAYVAAGEGGLQILDIANPAAIQPLGHYPTPNPCIDLATSGTLVYLLTKTDKNQDRIDSDNPVLLIVNAADPASPVLLSTTPVEPPKHGESSSDDSWLLKKLGPAIYLVSRQKPGQTIDTSTCMVIDVSNPMRPLFQPNEIIVRALGDDDKEISTTSTGRPSIVSYAGWYLCLPAGYLRERDWDSLEEYKLAILDLSDPLNPVPVFDYDAMQTAEHVALYKKTLYIADGDSGLVILRRGQTK